MALSGKVVETCDKHHYIVSNSTNDRPARRVVRHSPKQVLRASVDVIGAKAAL